MSAIEKKDLGEFTLHVPGVHNILNATAAIAVGMGLDVPRRKRFAPRSTNSAGWTGAFSCAGGRGGQRDRRLRSPSHGDQSDAGGGAAVRIWQSSCGVSAAPLHPHARSDGRIHARRSVMRTRCSCSIFMRPARKPIEGISGGSVGTGIREKGGIRAAICRIVRGGGELRVAAIAARGRHDFDPGSGQRIAAWADRFWKSESARNAVGQLWSTTRSCSTPRELARP